MHCRPSNIIIPLIVFILLNASLQAQQVEVKATVDRTTILIGEPIKLKLEANVLANTRFNWFKLDSIAHFEIIDKGSVDSAPGLSYKQFWQQIVITSFDSGRWTIPAFVLQSGNKRFRTDTFSISVTYSPDTAKDYHDIKDIIPVKDPGNPYIPWIIAAAALLALLGIIYLFRKKKIAPKTVQQPVSKLSPLEEAMQALEALRKEHALEKGTAKQYYTRLNDILRQYVSRKFNFSSLEKTNDEIIMQLRQARLPTDEYTLLAQTLRMADFVKFAKYTPSGTEQEESYQTIKKSITRMDALAST
ncbi:MAG TPA: hypothetical protein VD993_20075 [Chitinophagaceae bacterium]|nr:hypothetical protein [Chitinophagaceae bacterium]